MREVFRLRVLEAGAGWATSLERMGQAGLVRVVPEGEVGPLMDEHMHLLSEATQGQILLRHRDARVTDAEAQAGRCLIPLLNGEGSLLRGRGQPVVLAVDAHGERPAGLAWELLATRPDGPPLELLREAVVVRLLHGRADGAVHERPATRRYRIRTVLVTDTSNDVAVREVAAAVHQVTAELGLPPPVPELVREPGDLVVAHLVAHGQEDGTLFELVNEGVGSDALTARLPWLPQVDLVVVSICHAGRLEWSTSLPERLLRLGVPACVAPRGPVRAEAAATFITHLYRALHVSADLVEAVAAGRQAVTGLALPHPDARWHRLSLSVGTLRQAADPPFYRPAWVPARWPRPAPDAAAILDDVRAAAQTKGYAGVEHLVTVLRGRSVDQALQVHLSLTNTELARLQRLWAEESAEPPEATPWLTALGAHLQDDFTQADLEAALVRHGGLHLAVLSGGQGGQQIRSRDGATQPQPGPIHELEILFGPEGGRRLPASPGVSIGRAHRETMIGQPLYADTRAADTALSRTALVWTSSKMLVDGRTGAQVEFIIGRPRRFGDCTWLLPCSSWESNWDATQ